MSLLQGLHLIIPAPAARGRSQEAAGLAGRPEATEAAGW